MKALCKLIFIVSCLFFVSTNTSSYGDIVESDTIIQNYNIIYNNQEHKTDALIQNGEIYLNINIFKEVFGFQTLLNSNNLVIKDAVNYSEGTFDDEGNLYIGETLNGKRHGQGTLYIKEGGKYQGQWKEDRYNGNGTLVFSDGSTYIGGFSKGFMHGSGQLFYPDGSYYKGHYLYGVREGFGLYYVDSDNKYNGYWANGLRNGKGKAYINGVYKKGLWENNLLIKNLAESNFDF